MRADLKNSRRAKIKWSKTPYRRFAKHIRIQGNLLEKRLPRGGGGVCVSNSQLAKKSYP